MRTYESMMERLIDNVERLAHYIDMNDNVKEYLIEVGLYDEDNEPETNVWNIIGKELC